MNFNGLKSVKAIYNGLDVICIVNGADVSTGAVTEVTEVTFDDRDSNLTYVGSGWLAATSASFFNSTYKYANSSGSSVKFNFTGTSFKFITSTSTSGYSDSVNVKIDGISHIISLSTSAANQKIVYSDLALEDKEHYVEIITLKSLYLIIDAFKVRGILKPYVNLFVPAEGIDGVFDDRNANITYLGTWVEGNSQPLYINNTFKYTVSLNSSLQFNFTGTKFEFVTATSTSSFSTNVNVKIDGIDHIISLIGISAQQQIVYSDLALIDKEHYIEIINLEAKTLMVDAFNVKGLLKPYKATV